MTHVHRIDAFRCEYAFLSNFYPSLIRYDGIHYPTVEHAFQACKSLDSPERLTIAQCGPPARAKSMGRRVKLRHDWESIKVEVMTKLVRLKFETHDDLRVKLIDTGEAELIEGNTWNDRFWGVCGTQGRNWLGRILMQVRTELA
ncbi:MAG: NADAR family protein [Planctomycetaceae bacterium]|nr:NADAR family protein [Planctomycetaceae bacterium]